MFASAPLAKFQCGGRSRYLLMEHNNVKSFADHDALPEALRPFLGHGRTPASNLGGAKQALWFGRHGHTVSLSQPFSAAYSSTYQIQHVRHDPDVPKSTRRLCGDQRETPQTRLWHTRVRNAPRVSLLHQPLHSSNFAQCRSSTWVLSKARWTCDRDDLVQKSHSSLRKRLVLVHGHGSATTSNTGRKVQPHNKLLHANGLRHFQAQSPFPIISLDRLHSRNCRPVNRVLTIRPSYT
ncbi:hypothetical protein BKA66DRAFT_438914 [Pyrenochaeta sp. MPI-SDFR-AT-0127]|nr:hypothetical protein BKA66DRAFT_438914 [Pyrenochaeta sp. MPI-SDFR-AT-0127]